jgi:glycosyltransferase EpsE
MSFVAPVISVAMGVYNVECTLVEAVNSIKKQSFTNFELILCDDGSTDSTLSLCRRLAAEDSRIRVLANERNLGLNYTLNRCLAEARGEFYARMDGDDTCSPERFDKLLAALENNPDIAVVSSWMTCFDEQGSFATIRTKPKPEARDFAHGSPFIHAAAIMRTSVLRRLGGYGTEPWLRRSQDYHLWFRLYAAGYRGINIQESLYQMRDNRDAARRRTFQVRLNTARIMFWGFRLLKLPVWSYPRIARPLLLGLMPQWLYQPLRQRYRSFVSNRDT